MLIQDNLLGNLGHAGRVPHRRRAARALQRVDQRGLTHVGETHDSDRDRRLQVLVTRVVLEQL